jgi:hypothetical protein
MEVFVNERKAKVNSQIGRWASLGGLAVLIAGMIVSIRNPSWIWVSMLSLAVGFLASVVGAYYANHWTRRPRADEVLTQALKGISNQYHFYHYFLPASHVLLGPAGMFVFRTYLHEGPIQYDGKRWKQKFSWLRLLGFSGQDSLADPVRDALYDVERLRQWLLKRLPQEKLPPIEPFIVFVRDGAELDVAETEVPVLSYTQLKKTLRQIDKECTEPLEENQLYEIEQAMVGDVIDDL